MREKLRQFFRDFARGGLRPEIQACLDIGDRVKADEITKEEGFREIDRVLGITRDDDGTYAP